MIGEHWAAEGHEVTVFTAHPAYREEEKPMETTESFHGMAVIRCKLPFRRSRKIRFKAISGIIYLLKLFAFILRRRQFDVVLCSTMPPVLIGVVSRIASKWIGAKFIYQCMDIHPEVAVETGMMRWSFLTRMLQRLDRWACRRADCVHVLSRDMARVYQERESETGHKVPISIIPNFGIEAFSSQSREGDTAAIAGSESREIFEILFAGNMGRFQALPELIDAMTLLKDESGIQLTLVGTGNIEEALKETVRERGLTTVEFCPFQPIDVTRRMIRRADLCVVSLSPEVYRYAFPSKTTTIMAEGTPILAVVESNSELAEMVLEKRLGWTCEQMPDAIATAIRSAKENPGEISEIRKSIPVVYDTDFSAPAVLKQWSALLNKVAGEI